MPKITSSAVKSATLYSKKKPEPASAASLEKGEQGIPGGNFSWMVGCEVAESYALAILGQYPLNIPSPGPCADLWVKKFFRRVR